MTNVDAQTELLELGSITIDTLGDGRFELEPEGLTRMAGGGLSAD